MENGVVHKGAEACFEEGYMYRIIKSDLMTLFKSHKVVFWVIIFSVACSFAVFAMMTGVVSYEIQSAKKASMFHTFTMDLNGQSLGGTTFDKLLQNDKLRTAVLMQASGDRPLIVGWHGGNDDRWFILDEGTFFDRKGAGTDVAIVSQNLYPGIAFEERRYQADVAGRRPAIIGVGIIPQSSLLFIGAGEVYEKYYPRPDPTQLNDHEESDEANVDVRQFTTIIPAKNFLAYGLSANVVRIEYSLENANELAAVAAELQALLPEADIDEPQLPDEAYANEMSSAALRAILIIGCGFVNLVALFTYWLVCQRRSHTLYRLFGATKWYIVKIILIEWLILLFAGYLIGMVIQRLAKPFMLALSIANSMTVLSSLAVFLVLYAMSLLLMASQVMRNTRMDLEGI
ncbi:MAG: FtsX-like permease family protein [Clostridia bacterium]